MKKWISIIVTLYIASFLNTIHGQNKRIIYFSFEIVGTDTIINATLPETIVFPPLIFKDDKERLAYIKLVRDVKKTLPYANQVSQSIIETYEVMEMFPDKKSKQKHLKNAQKYIMEEYKPKMKKLTKNQGKILVKLIDRQTNSSAYDIVKAIVGPVKATMYNVFAGTFGNSLKTEYDPEGKDKMIERIVIQIEQGTL